MKYFTKEWYEACQAADWCLNMAVSKNAEEFSEEYYKDLYTRRRRAFVKQMKEEEGEAFDKIAAEVAFMKHHEETVKRMERILPIEIKAAVADMRVLALDIATKEVRHQLKAWCEEQKKLAAKAKELGAELFVVDDGWFGQRHGIDNGLGDWYVNKEKFPNGIDELIDEVKAQGLLFGIWVEPEMVNPKAELYAKHPDWIYHFDTRESDTSREQYVLDLTKNEVKAFVLEMLDNLLSNHEIDYIKWDANRPISQTNLKKDLWYKHIQALYDIVKETKKKHPAVLFEACASGGGRIDYGILGIFDDFWTSDNTDAYDRLFIQDAYSYIYPIKAMRAWVTDCPNFLSNRVIPMKFRYHSAMMGTLGIGCNILKFTEEDIALSQEMIAQYKEIRPIIQEGTFYRLNHTSANDYFLYEYMKGNEGVLFAFLPQSKLGHRGVTVKLRGLEENASYELLMEDGKLTKSGSYHMKHGFDMRLTGDYASMLIRINKL